jgi:hypothetical protein
MTALLSLLQFLAFDAAWFAAVAGGAGGWPWLGSLAAVAVVGVHLWLNRRAFWPEVRLILVILLFGVLLETGLMGAGVIHYTGVEAGHILPPVWIWALWLGFATLPTGSLGWLANRWKTQALLGALFGPLAYWTGAKMGAAQLPDPSGPALLAIAVAWALAFPAIMMMAQAISPRPSN